MDDDNYSQYDHTGDDPYVISGSTCLINRLGLTDTQALNAAEEQFVNIRMAELDAVPAEATFDLKHLCQIHERLFGDVYPFAGQIRVVDLSKGHQLVLPFRLIESEAEQCFRWLHAQRLLAGLDVATFGSEVGFFLGWVNKIHPFREGNGRTQRLLIDQLALHNGYVIEWSAMSKSAMVEACREARGDKQDCARLSKLIALNTVQISKN